MKDPRYDASAKLLVHHSMRVGRGDKVLIEAFDIPTDFTAGLIAAVHAAGGLPLASTYQQPVLRALFNAASAEQMSLLGSVEKARMEAMQCYCGLRGSHNISEMSDVPPEQMNLYERNWWTPVHQDVRVRKTRWVVLRWPTPSMAQAAGISTEAFEDFYFRVCADVDYGRMEKAMEPLVELMQTTDRVRIVGSGTELNFSIMGIPAIACFGRSNIPDGEVFTVPVRESIDGTMQYNCDTLYRGTVFSNVRLVFKAGKIIEATCTGKPQTEKLNTILDSDEGVRYVGEWSLAMNPQILQPMKDILFDEKISGSFHLTPGEAYDDADNGNHSQIHWDMVCIQRSDYGGGEIWFDGKTVRKDGIFTRPELAGLNPDRLGRRNMGKKDARVDQYIAKAAPFAQPVLRHIRKIVHANCPGVEESIKWQMPSFGYKGILCMMAAFKEHCTFGFWHPKMRKNIKTGDMTGNAMGQLGRIVSVSDLPGDKEFARLVRKAVELNDQSDGAPVRPRTKTKPEATVPEDMASILRKHPAAQAAFDAFPPSHRREYVEWITEAKRPETREKRMQTMLEWLAEGKSRNWKYEKC